MYFSKEIGNLSGDTFVGVNFAYSWTVGIWERYHETTELTPAGVDELIRLLKKAKNVLEREQKKYDSIGKL